MYHRTFSERLFEATVRVPGQGREKNENVPLASIAQDQSSGPRALSHQHFLIYIYIRVCVFVCIYIYIYIYIGTQWVFQESRGGKVLSGHTLK